MSLKTLILLGATGLVGGECLKRLNREEYYARIVVLGRSPLTCPCTQRIEQHTIDFDRIDEYRNLLKADHVLCALGSTLKEAGTKEQFFKVDFTYVYNIARITAEQNTERFLLVSSMGANSKSVFFYNRVKGRIEEALQSLPFRSIGIFRPSLILGVRRKSRLNETVSKWAAEIFSFAIPQRYRPIEASDIAAAILYEARLNRPGIRTYESDQIRNIAEKNPEHARPL